MKKHTFLVVVLSLLLTSGCATQTIQKGKDLSSSGIAYTIAVNNLLDATTDRLIDFDTEELKKTRRGSNLRKMIIEKNEAMVALLTEIANFRLQTKLLESYFVNLQALSDSPIKDDAGGVIRTLSDSISKLNKKIVEENKKVSLTDEQKKLMGALGGLIAKNIHAEKIRRALTRDAEVIAVYLSLQENQLETIAGILMDRFNAENDLFLEEKVIAPYVNKEQTLDANWAADRKEWFKTQFVRQQLETAREAAKQLRGVWVNILQGRTDTNSLRFLISDVNEFVTTVKALEAAGDSN